MIGGAEWLLAQPVPDGTSLYDGASGVALALLEVSRTTGDARFREAADRIGDRLGAAEDDDGPGFYAGSSGVAFVLRELGHDAWTRLTDRVAASDPGPVTDVISGAAGAGLWLVAAGATDAAVRLGEWLVDVAQPGPTRPWWPIRPGEPFNMPNFSHGTAGVAYFLARLSQVTGHERFLETAIGGAGYLRAIARRRDGTLAVHHSEPGGEGDYPLGWCHGPTGLARLFAVLHESTGDASFADDVRACARMVRSSGIPRRAFPGFWDNVSPCCGSARVAELFLDLHRAGGTEDDLAFCRTMTDDILARATSDADGTRWSNAEFRSDPPVLPPEPGFMQGNAGVIAWLYRWQRWTAGDDTHVGWPDSPW